MTGALDDDHDTTAVDAAWDALFQMADGVVAGTNHSGHNGAATLNGELVPVIAETQPTAADLRSIVYGKYQRPGLHADLTLEEMLADRLPDGYPLFSALRQVYQRLQIQNRAVETADEDLVQLQALLKEYKTLLHELFGDPAAAMREDGWLGHFGDLRECSLLMDRLPDGPLRKTYAKLAQHIRSIVERIMGGQAGQPGEINRLEEKFADLGIEKPRAGCFDKRLRHYENAVAKATSENAEMLGLAERLWARYQALYFQHQECMTALEGNGIFS